MEPRGPEHKDAKRAKGQTGPSISMEQRARRLNSLKGLHQNAQRRQNKDHNRHAHQNIYRPFEDAVYGVFQGLISQTNKVSGMEAIKRYIMPKDLGEIIYNMQTNTCLVCDGDEERERFRIEGNL